MGDTHSMADDQKFEFDVAVTFAGENRDYVNEIVESIKGDVKVFYDEDYEHEAWGEDGVEYFTNVYMNRARYAIMFISQFYAEKMWTNVERRAALARAANQHSAYILPIRLDDTELVGLLPTVIYLDARRLGIEGLIKAIKSKISGTKPESPSSALLDGKVPRTQGAIEALMTERVGTWEYLLYAGLLKSNMEKLESKYQDFAMGYARRNGQRVTGEELEVFSRSAIESIYAITNNIDVVLDSGVQERAFGAPGEPGDIDRIVHMADRFISVYEEFMDWAAELRGTVAPPGAANDAVRTLARWAEQPVEECRRFVSRYVAELDTLGERLEAGETVEIEMALTLELDAKLVDAFNEKLQEAMSDNG